MTDLKKKMRPEIPSIKNKENYNAEEKFQNNVLRPIIKLQHDLILHCFETYIKHNKIKIAELNVLKKRELTQKIFKTNTRLKIELRGLIIGLFTLDEYKEYLNYPAQLNRRINNMIQQRIDSCYD